jgi:hypothetical protein
MPDDQNVEGVEAVVAAQYTLEQLLDAIKEVGLYYKEHPDIDQAQLRRDVINMLIGFTQNKNVSCPPEWAKCHPSGACVPHPSLC